VSSNAEQDEGYTLATIANQISESRMIPSPFGAKVQNSRRMAGAGLKVKGK
jgi:hypothetical protein